MISIAIDGPAGSGKSTVAKLLSKKLNIMYINTGAMYRTVALKALENGILSNEIDKLCNLIDSLDMYFEGENLIVNGVIVNDKISTPEISKNASKYACIREVREKLVKIQKNISKNHNVVMDGRDIGTVVLKDTPFKFYLNASSEERAKRRFKELKERNIHINYEVVLDDIINRDYNDSHREIDPLKKSKDAIEIDSTNLSIEEVVNIIEKRIKDIAKKW